MTDIRARLEEIDGRLHAAADLLGQVEHDPASNPALRLVDAARQQVAALWGELALSGWA